jgi:3'(2'), 5'-bisphosphate nucleotidase
MAQEKGEDDLFTIADVTVQKTIIYNLQQLYPTLKIIGEEEDTDLYNSVEPTI